MADLPQLDSNILFKITKEIKRSTLQQGLRKELAYNLTTNDVIVTDEDVMAVGDALKFNAFFVPTFVINDAVGLARGEREADDKSKPDYWKR